MEVSNPFVVHVGEQTEWAVKTFGPGPRAAGVIDHIQSELQEIAADPGDLEEWIDVIFLAIDGAARQGYNGQEIWDALRAKLVKNKSRRWPDWRTMDPNKSIEHIRGFND